jgi:hypothetical protein
MQPVETEAAPDDEAAARKLRVALTEITGKLQGEAERRAAARRTIEDRWIDDLRRIHGVPDEETAGELAKDKNRNKSKLNINIVRPKCREMHARLGDMLFASDESCWGLEPSPNPTLTIEAEQAAQKARDARKQASEAIATEKAGGAEQPSMPTTALIRRANELAYDAQLVQAQIEEARSRARAMEQEIADQLAEARFEAEARRVIQDGIDIGCGVLKAPALGVVDARRWRPSPDGGMRLVDEGVPKPAAVWTDPWGFYPDPTVRRIEDSEGVFTREMFTASKLRRIGRAEGWDKDALREILREGPKDVAPTYLSQLRAIREETSQDPALFHVWCYSGPLTAEDAKTLAYALGEDGMVADIGEPDPLDEVNVVIWWCQNRPLKIADYPLDSGQPLYRVYSLQKDPASLFGYGLSWILRDEQSAMGAAWRMLMDNAAVSAPGPMVVIDKGGVQPADGVWEVRGGKVWERTKDSYGATNPPFAAFPIPTNQQELAAIIQMISEHVDRVTSMPRELSGEPGKLPRQTATGAALLMSSGNVIYRDAVKTWDDDCMVPVIQAMRDWNMQHSKKGHIKGDMDAVAKGSSVLLTREVQSQTLMAMALNLAPHPIFGSMHRDGGAPLLREIYRVNGLRPDQYLLTDDELAEQAENAPVDPAVEAATDEIEVKRERIEADVAIAQMESQARVETAKLAHESQMMGLAEKLNMTMEQLRAQLQMDREDRDSKERIVAVELAEKRRSGDSAGGYV